MNWKNTALNKQLDYKKNTLKLDKSGKYGKKQIEYKQILSDEDALKGANFYCFSDSDEWQNLKNWADTDKGKKIKFEGAGMKNMLRSEHIPYNFFYPLEKLRKQNPDLLATFLQNLLLGEISVDKVIRIKIEFASDLHKSKLLNDNTSFDAYIEYMSGNKKCGLGIEVKYTEKSYPYGTTEKANLDSMSSEYWKTAIKSDIYDLTDENKKSLIEKKQKQAFRNHLLGLKLIDEKQLDQFHSLHFYPEGNTYQHQVAKNYKKCLKPQHKNSFQAISFEHFIQTAKDLKGVDSNWSEYLEERY